LGTAPKERSIAKVLSTCQVVKPLQNALCNPLTRRRGHDLGVAKEARGFFRRRGTDVEARAPLEPSHFS